MPTIIDARELDSLGSLIDPKLLTDSITLASFSSEWGLSKLADMLLIRFAEEVIGDLVLGGSARCPCHLGIGQEAVAVGVSDALRATDRVFGAHRSHSHYLALGGKIYPLLAEILGRADGCSRGMGGSMHLIDRSIGFWGSVPIVGATIPIAVGAALAAKFDRSDDIAVSYFGDGATEEGGFHESMNLAAAHKLPVLFVCENNLYASHLDINLRQPSDTVARFAVAHRMPALVVDGNDVVSVAQATSQLVANIRNGGGPGFLEAVTYRWRGHVGPDENIDVGTRRKADDVLAWKERDPIRRLSQALVATGLVTETELNQLNIKIKLEIEQALESARTAEYPASSSLLETVFITNAIEGKCQ